MTELHAVHGAIGSVENVPSAESALIPLVFSRCTALQVEHPLRSEMAASYKETWFANQLLVHQVRPMLLAMTELGARPIVLKGGALLSSAYHGDLGARPCFDIDVLIDPASVDSVLQLSEREGWSLSSPRSLEEVRRFHHAADLVKGSHGAVDVHWELLAHDRSPQRTALLFERTVPATLDTIDVRILEPTWLLFHCLAHSKPEGFRHLADALTILGQHQESIDWVAIVNEAMDRRELAATEHQLRAVAEVRPDMVPTWVLDQLASAKHHWTDYVFAGTVVTSRRSGVKRMAADLAGRTRGADPMVKLRAGRILVRKYVDESGVSLKQKVISFATKGPTGKR